MSTTTYPLPPPTTTGETRRLNYQHQLSLLDTNGALILGPFPLSSEQDKPDHQRPLRVADLGTGTGIWATDFAHRYPSAHVVGYDLDLPHKLPEAPWPDNVHFAIQDITDPWPAAGPTAGPFDLVHGRQVLLNLRTPEVALRRAWESLRPGGMIELRESWNPMVSELEQSGANSDGGHSHVPLLTEWHRRANEAAANMGCDHEYAARLPAELEKAGFVDVEFSDSHIPLGGWMADGGKQDERTHEMNTVLRELFAAGVPGMTKTLFSQGLNWSEVEATEYAARVVKEFDREDLGADRISIRFRNAWGKRPLDS